MVVKAIYEGKIIFVWLGKSLINLPKTCTVACSCSSDGKGT